MAVKPDVISSVSKEMAKLTKYNSSSLLLWGCFLSLTILVWMFGSSGDFSFLLTFAALWRCFGFGLLNYKVWSGMNVRSVSMKTLVLYSTCFSFRLLSIMRHQGYLPFDKTGDWLYHAVEFFSLAAAGLLLFAIFGPLKSTYEDKFDRFGNLPPVPREFGAVYLIAPALLLAIFFHPNLNKEFFSDTCWTFSMYVEAVAMLPQIYMFQKQAAEENGMVEAMIGHTVFALGFSRVFELIFWVGSFKELAHEAWGQTPGYIVLLSQLAHLVIMADFFYYYFISISKGAPMELPQSYVSSNV